jgi:hypothetical protein
MFGLIGDRRRTDIWPLIMSSLATSSGFSSSSVQAADGHSSKYFNIEEGTDGQIKSMSMRRSGLILGDVDNA